MVVGSDQHIEAGILDRLQILIGGTELRIALIRLACQGHFQVGNSQVGLLYLGLHQRKAGIIIVTGRRTGGIDLSLMLHQVTGKQQVDSLCRGSMPQDAA